MTRQAASRLKARFDTEVADLRKLKWESEGPSLRHTRNFNIIQRPKFQKRKMGLDSYNVDYHMYIIPA